MIHGNSNDPVLIKRIGLKIWSLRDEVESVIQQHLAHNTDGKNLSPQDIQEIRNEYAYSGPLEQKAGLQLIDGGAGTENAESTSESGDDLEAAMAAAMGGGEDAGGSESGDDLEAAMAAAMGGDEIGESGDSEESGDDLEAAMAAAMGGGDDSAQTPTSPTASPQGGAKKIIQRGSQNIKAERISRGVSILSELSMSGLYFFSEKKFMEGQSIVIEFQIPKRFVLNAIVSFCRPFNISSRIISNRKVEYRTVAKFTFLKEGERTLLREFIKSIEPDIPAPMVAAPKQQDEGGDDDFDGLDGLDF